MSLNILIGSNVHWWNAEAAYAAATAELLQKAGNRVFVLTRPGSINAETLQKRGLTVITDIDLNTFNPFRLIRSFQKLKQFLRTNQIQIVNPHRSEGFFIYILLKWKLQSFKLVRTRGTTRSVRRSGLNRKIYCDWVDAHICTGQVVLERILSSFPIPIHKQHVIYYPIELPAFSSDDITRYNDEFKISRDQKTLCIVGRISPIKGHELLLHSFRQLLESFPHCTLLVLYKHPDPKRPELLVLEEKCKELQIESQVRFIGPRTDIREIMKFADVGIVSSLDSEVICRVAVEFFSAKTPVVAFETGCLPEIIQDGRNGIVVKRKDINGLAEALRVLLSDEGLLKRLGAGALQSAEHRFSQRLFLEKTLKVFQSVLN
ncbi:MAG: glycosyltransferase family 4 protein [SAR324 cluster bacterium]|nr:glycosyltransferase family 4 protein [SAR324 cluster bacterium]